MAYANVVYATLSAMVTELLSSVRRTGRFTRFRARQRVMHHMASTVVYGKKIVPDEDVRPVSERGRNKTDAVKEDIARRRKKRKEDWKRHKEKKRVVFLVPQPLDTVGAALARERPCCGPLVFSPLSCLCTSTTRPSVAAIVVLRSSRSTVRVCFAVPKARRARTDALCRSLTAT